VSSISHVRVADRLTGGPTRRPPSRRHQLAVRGFALALIVGLDVALISGWMGRAAERPGVPLAAAVVSVPSTVVAWPADMREVPLHRRPVAIPPDDGLRDRGDGDRQERRRHRFPEHHRDHRVAVPDSTAPSAAPTPSSAPAPSTGTAEPSHNDPPPSDPPEAPEPSVVPPPVGPGGAGPTGAGSAEKLRAS
jgi:hypothetical protein